MLRIFLAIELACVVRTYTLTVVVVSGVELTPVSGEGRSPVLVEEQLIQKPSYSWELGSRDMHTYVHQ